MTIICWGNLAKAANDTLRIEQAMQGYIEGHDENPNAHMGPDYALGAHRLQIELDHLPYSVLNKFLYPQSRTYKAVVDPAGFGDVTTIQGAIDYVHSIGGGAIYIKAGTYHIGADITLYSNIILEGEDMDTTILDFDDTTYHISGVGESLSHLRNIEFHKLQIKDCNNSDGGIIGLTYCDDVTIDSIKVYSCHDPVESLAIPVKLNNCNRINVTNNYISTNDVFLHSFDSQRLKVEYNYIYHCQGYLFYLYKTPNCIIRHNYFESNGLDWGESLIYFSDACNNLVIDSNQFLLCGTMVIWNEYSGSITISNNVITPSGTVSDAIALNDIDKSVLVGNKISGFNNNGIYLGDNCDKNTVVGNVVVNNGDYGVVIAAATCSKNVVVGNCLTGNTDGAVNDLGTDSVVANNAT